MTEYWLQKKTIGGWSMVTWYDNKDQAIDNYSKCLSNVGYSWRLVEVNTLMEHRLQEETVIEAPEIEVKKTSWGATVQPKPVVNHPPKSSGWATPVPALVTDGWGNSKPDIKEHGMVGKVWMVHHQKMEKIRANPADVVGLEAAGYVRGGPKTKFER